jgi:aminobenzoyl-glutamate utilization protein B
VTLRFPSNLDGLPGHHWSRAMTMATPIAHKGANVGAKVLAATMVDLLENPGLIDAAWAYFRDEQLQGTVYEPFIGPDDAPAIEKNRDTMAEFRSRLEAFYYDPSR